MLAGYAIPLFILRPFQNVPYLDDWTYAWSVENLLKTGTLRILDWSTHINVAQILWATLFCLPFGFSFTALRVSTWVLAVVGLFGFYFLLRELNVSARDSLIGTAALACSPIYVLLSFSFMTDIPAITFAAWSILMFLKFLRTEEKRWLIASSALAILTIATRLLGLALPLALSAFLFLHRRFSVNRWRSLVIAGVVPVLFAAALIYWHSSHVEHRTDLRWVVGSPENRTFNLRYGVRDFHYWLMLTVVYGTAPLGILLSPLVIAGLQRAHFRKALLGLGLVAVIIGIGVATGKASFNQHGANWRLVDLGGSRGNVWGGTVPPSSSSPKVIAGVLGLVLFGCAAGIVLSARRSKGMTVMFWLLLVQTLPVIVLWLWDPRYLLGLLPWGIALILAATPIRRPKAAVGLIVTSAALSIAALHDELDYNRALWSGVEHLVVQSGAPIPRIHGGYTVNGWLQYAHPENATVNEIRDVEVQLVNVQNDNYDYLISNRLEPNWILIEEVPVRSWLKSAKALYVLKRPDS